MSIDIRKPMPAGSSPARRRILQGGAAAAGMATLGFPAVVGAQPESIRIGHLTPMTGFLGALGEYAAMGIKMAAEEINAAGGVLGRKIDLISEDSVNPQVASSKAQRMIERDKVVVLMGEINSASALTISQVAARNTTLFMNIGARSDALRGKDCNRYTFHVDIPVTVMVNAVGLALVRDNLVKGRKIFSLTADYLFGHDLSRAAKKFFAAHGGNVVADELVATDVTDFSPFLLKIRQARPDLISTNLAGNQVTNFVKQYAEFGLPFPVVGFDLAPAFAWAAGEENFSGTWPCRWHHDLAAVSPSAKAFVEAFTARYKKPPEDQGCAEYVTMKLVAKAIDEIKSTDSDKLIEHFEKEGDIDVLKARPGHFRKWDHQLVQQMYTMTPKPKGQPRKDKFDFLALSAPVPGDGDKLEALAPTPEQNACTMA